ncbi:glucose-6-phosphate exchanger SLC37A1 isoform X1 [Maylandia zebra]|uniref:glucose-6-phosphate exchanger SLC37A1 isoform X1 n=1 Tax=Maylandia zebra TaxID=106582 RepID=UPI00403C6C65
MAPVPPGVRLLVSFDRDQCLLLNKEEKWPSYLHLSTLIPNSLKKGLILCSSRPHRPDTELHIAPSRYRALTFILTFLLYTSFHLSRKPISIVKSELHKNCSAVSEAAIIASSSSQQPSLLSLHTDVDCSWKPFDKSNYKQLLGAMDYSFLCAYAIGMYLSGIIGERLPIRLYLTVGMLASGVFTCLFGLGYIYNIHNLSFYIFVQVANGLVQTAGWPSVVTCIGNWFGKGRRGLIMGLWNSHTSVGNILGSLIAGYWVSSNWGMSFIVPGLIIIIMGVVCFLFLIEHPNDLKNIYTQNSSLGKTVPSKSWNGVNGHTEVYLQYKDNKNQVCYYYKDSIQNRKSYDTELLLPRESERIPMQPVVVVKSESEPSAISFMGALRIPGVVEFSLCLLFAKLVSYTFLFWLPLYITKAAHLDAKKAGDLSTLFDVGGIVGGVLAGVISDKLGKRATTCAVMLLLAAPTLYGFSMISEFGLGPMIGMLLVCGGLVNGPYALITTAVSADLGTHKSLKGNARALSTVTAIIDGTGSVGAALGPLLAGLLSAGGWDQVFYMLMTADFLALLLLLRLVTKELASSKSHPISTVELKEH